MQRASIPDAIARCVASGARRIVAVPYFLHTGTHVCEDLPALLEAAERQHPQVEFLLGDYIGLSPRLTDLLASRAAETAVPAEPAAC
jgi:sirohydrochlorin ferrochelatase